ncbi:unnamed protein product [Trichogramma brassicae]|uniref:Uncharacterized protein n=1 Tax=Trichogramma brassicae TaxID=86971 RepID=A0A6H5J8R5_9HYME|nr:unnamed protein product [Trichogramma brassicae]
MLIISLGNFYHRKQLHGLQKGLFTLQFIVTKKVEPSIIAVFYLSHRKNSETSVIPKNHFAVGSSSRKKPAAQQEKKSEHNLLYGLMQNIYVPGLLQQERKKGFEPKQNGADILHVEILRILWRSTRVPSPISLPVFKFRHASQISQLFNAFFFSFIWKLWFQLTILIINSSRDSQLLMRSARDLRSARILCTRRPAENGSCMRISRPGNNERSTGDMSWKDGENSVELLIVRVLGSFRASTIRRVSISCFFYTFCSGCTAAAYTFARIEYTFPEHQWLQARPLLKCLNTEDVVRGISCLFLQQRERADAPEGYIKSAVPEGARACQLHRRFCAGNYFCGNAPWRKTRTEREKYIVVAYRRYSYLLLTLLLTAPTTNRASSQRHTRREVLPMIHFKLIDGINSFEYDINLRIALKKNIQPLIK